MIFVVDNLPKSEKRGVVVEGFRDRAADNGRPYADDANLAMPGREASTSRVGGIVRAARTTRLLWQRNGARWLIAFGLCAAQSRATRFLTERLRKMERARNLPGFFEPDIAAHVWQNYDWQSGGEEWSVSAAWRESIVENVIDVWLRPGAAVLEIGPGAGRWTGYLHQRARRLVLLDVTPRCLELCQSRFEHSEINRIPPRQRRGFVAA